jgi:D-alanyl-lipoteichoic acid acyltransferase DltB (MBOAT superfamily)
VIAPLGLFLIVLGLTVPLYWACLGPLRALRPAVMIGASLTLTFLLNPVVPLVTLCLFAAVWAAVTWAGQDETRKAVLVRGAWATFLVLLVPEVVPPSILTN